MKNNQVKINKNTKNLPLKMTLLKGNGLIKTAFRKSIYNEDVKSITWGGLVTQLSNFYKVASKENLPAIVPVDWKEDYQPALDDDKNPIVKNGETAIRRCKENINLQYMLILDIDGDGVSFERFKQMFKRKLEFFMHTSSSHGLDGGGDRYRVLIPLKTPVTGDFIASRKEAIKNYLESFVLGHETVIDDESTFARSRLFYLAGGAKEEHKELYKQFYSNNGNLLDITGFEENKGKLEYYSSKPKEKITDDAFINFYDIPNFLSEIIENTAEQLLTKYKAASKNKGDTQSFELSRELAKLGIPQSYALIYLQRLKTGLPKSEFDPKHKVNTVYSTWRNEGQVFLPTLYKEHKDLKNKMEQWKMEKLVESAIPVFE
ncbi:hypothetical protein [Pseudoalteromonas sp. JC3]|uniref:hypothetical protein n=1 Tax=Pseudoalteromonas sp. JC3 TaxID=2810196 RepID=UPI0019D233EF|nr:hypothetical protein [Pseudoalteromonas sp. JC3]MBR8841683.1 hypothetical protein [Pseudoalteromonas sp. JC3]WJE07707.1 hypothetical protein QSH61_12480 [Pseudoalteromonas sp. JC3]